LATSDVLCLYHGNCSDGSASAAVIRYRYPGAVCIPVTHGEPLAVDVTGKDLFIVDFSFPPDVMTELKQKAKAVHWYDHHITSVPVHEKLGWGVIDLKESGASLTWKQEFPNQPVPRIIQYVRDKDLYEWKLPDSRALSMDLGNNPDVHRPESATWKELIDGVDDREWNDMIRRGTRALEEQRQRVIRGAKNGFEVDFLGHRAFAVNWSLEASDIGEYIYTELKYPLAILFYYNGETWTFSLRSPSIDCSQLALKFGGGGHPGAAGFRIEDIAQFLKMKK